MVTTRTYDTCPQNPFQKYMIKRKQEQIAIRLSTEEKAWLIKEADKWEVSVSQIIRSFIKSRREISKAK